VNYLQWPKGIKNVFTGACKVPFFPVKNQPLVGLISMPASLPFYGFFWW
jgi:hypothetical protein